MRELTKFQLNNVAGGVASLVMVKDTYLVTAYPLPVKKGK